TRPCRRIRMRSRNCRRTSVRRTTRSTSRVWPPRTRGTRSRSSRARVRSGSRPLPTKWARCRPHSPTRCVPSRAERRRLTDMATRFTDLVGCELPVQLAGMGGGGSDVGLTSAVCNAGGFGTLGAGGLPAPVIEQMLDAMPQATDRPFGINFLMPLLDRDAVSAAVRRSRVVEFFYGDPDAALVDI